MQRPRHCSRLLTAVVAGVALLWPTAARPWGTDGHELIARAAARQLSAQEVQRLEAIFANRVLDMTYTDDEGRQRNCTANNPREIASWADCVRDNRALRSGGFHYDDVPYCGNAPKPAWCRNGDCGSEALRRFIAQANNPNSSAFDRAFAVAFIIHIIGDLHQPLHANDNNDSGGNGISIRVARGALRFGGGSGKLHSFWDTPMVREATGGVGDPVVAIVNQASSAPSGWAVFDPDAWVNEAHLIGVAAYRRLPRPPRCGDGSHNAGTISARYVNHFRPIVQEQLTRASVRLAAVLRGIV